MANTIMPHTNTIEALTLELDRVNQFNDLLIKVLATIIRSHDLSCKGEDCQTRGIVLGREILKKAESR